MGNLLLVGATVVCSHANSGQATPMTPNTRVTVSGQATVTQNTSYVVAGCINPPPSQGGTGPCVSAQWTSAATRITSGGQPLLLSDSQAICSPTGTPLIVTKTQTRVTGT